MEVSMLKGIVQPKMKILSSFSWIFLLNTKNDMMKKTAVDFFCMFLLLMSVAAFFSPAFFRIYCFVFNRKRFKTTLVNAEEIFTLGWTISFRTWVELLKNTSEVLWHWISYCVTFAGLRMLHFRYFRRICWERRGKLCLYNIYLMVYKTTRWIRTSIKRKRNNLLMEMHSYSQKCQSDQQRQEADAYQSVFEL